MDTRKQLRSNPADGFDELSWVACRGPCRELRKDVAEQVLERIARLSPSVAGALSVSITQCRLHIDMHATQGEECHLKVLLGAETANAVSAGTARCQHRHRGGYSRSVPSYHILVAQQIVNDGHCQLTPPATLTLQTQVRCEVGRQTQLRGSLNKTRELPVQSAHGSV
eukprot:scaffold245022_cov32-Tisochrysis_lutea.AAC.4